MFVRDVRPPKRLVDELSVVAFPFELSAYVILDQYPIFLYGACYPCRRVALEELDGSKGAAVFVALEALDPASLLNGEKGPCLGLLVYQPDGKALPPPGLRAVICNLYSPEGWNGTSTTDGPSSCRSPMSVVPSNRHVPLMVCSSGLTSFSRSTSFPAVRSLPPLPVDTSAVNGDTLSRRFLNQTSVSAFQLWRAKCPRWYRLRGSRQSATCWLLILTTMWLPLAVTCSLNQFSTVVSLSDTFASVSSLPVVLKPNTEPVRVLGAPLPATSPMIWIS